MIGYHSLFQNKATLVANRNAVLRRKKFSVNSVSGSDSLSGEM
jgi:hypothetical protein